MTTTWTQYIQQLTLSQRPQDKQVPVIFPITDLSVIRVHGPDAESFLQGQITADITQLNEAQVGIGALCNPKGRIQANFIYFKQDSSYFMLVPSQQTQATLARLKKYAMFSKVTLEDQSKNWCAFGKQSDHSDPSMENDIVKLQLPGNRPCELIVSTNEQALIQAFNQLQKNGAAVYPKEHWARLQIESGLAFITPETETLFTPQMLNLEKLGGVSFSKGCYVGQEIIARTQHLGKLKRHLYQFHCDAPTIKIGDTIQATSSTNAGTVIQATPINNTEMMGLAVIEDRLLDDHLHLNDQPLHKLNLLIKQ